MDEQPRQDGPRYTDGLRRWTTKDYLAVRCINEGGAKFSPSGERFSFITLQNDLEADLNVWTVHVFATADVTTALDTGDPAPEPLCLFDLRAPKFPLRGSIAWEDEETTLSFQAFDQNGVRQLYTVDLRTGVKSALTAETDTVLSIQKKQDTVVTTVSVPDDTPSPAGYPVHAVTHQELMNALFRSPRTRPITRFSRPGEPAWELTSSRNFDSQSPVFASDGMSAIAIRTPLDAPAGWSTYDRVAEAGDHDELVLGQFMLIDIEQKLERPLFDAPVGNATYMGAGRTKPLDMKALWASDESHVILVNTCLPLSTTDDPARCTTAYLAAYDFEREHVEAITPIETTDEKGVRRVSGVSWASGVEGLVVQYERYGEADGDTTYQREGDKWVVESERPPPAKPEPKESTAPAPTEPEAARAEAETASTAFAVDVRQSVNDPPVVVASKDGRELVLTPPDPALEGVWYARCEPFTWQETGGQQTGGLFLPRETSGPVPLVINAYTYDPDEFVANGMGQCTYVAQSLVARGIAVALINIPLSDSFSNVGPQELTIFGERIDALTHELAGRNIIDPDRVGLIGFSRGGFNAYYAITHPGAVTLAAAVIDDAYPGTFSYMLHTVNIMGPQRASSSEYEGSFWPNKERWLELEPSFNIDRVMTPTLFSSHHQSSLNFKHETRGAFRALRRPYDLLLYPDGEHNLESPRQRHANFEASADWMSFWLQGHEDPAPQKAAQFRRWRQLRTDWELQKAWEAAGHPVGDRPDGAD